MKRRSFALILLFASLVLGSCGASPPLPSALQVQDTGSALITTMNVAKVAITQGNHTYIPLNLEGDASVNIQNILWALGQFEQAYLVEVTSWKIEEKNASFFSKAYVYGIWIDHHSYGIWIDNRPIG